MVEESQNQKPLKRIKVEEDRISSLPDCLIIEILSRLPSIKQAITTGVLSKRWKHLWTYVPALVFREYECRLFNFFPFVSETLRQCCQTKPNKFKLILHSNKEFESHIKSWVHCAIRCNVEEFHLNLKNWDLRGDSVLDELFFTASCFTHLKLYGCILLPSTAITWEKLKSLHILGSYLDEDLIQNILSGSPLLETLKMNSCYGFKRLDITSKSVKNLVLSDLYVYDKFVEINAPNVLSITIKGPLWLSKLLLLNVSSLVKAKLDYKKYGHTDKEAKEEMLKGLLLRLRHVKEVNIGISCFKALSRLKAKGFIPTSNLKFPMNEAVFFDNNLVSIHIHSDSD